MTKVHLLLPGILWPLEENKLDKPPVRTPTLEKLLVRSQCADFIGKDLSETLFHLFGVTKDLNIDYPVGAVSYCGNGGVAADNCWAKVTPVHFIVDRDRVLLVGPEQLTITPVEAESLARDFNKHFKEEGLSLLVQQTDDWYLQLSQCPVVNTYDVDFVVGHNIENYLPYGSDRTIWLKIINETQMLFCQSDVNQKRMALGMPTINGLWFSGFGKLPSLNERYSAVISTIPLAKGLASLSGSPCHEGEKISDYMSCIVGETIYVYSEFLASKRAQDIQQWKEALRNIDIELKQVLKNNTCNEVSIYTCSGKVFNADNRKLMQFFWRPKKNILKIIR